MRSNIKFLLYLLVKFFNFDFTYIIVLTSKKITVMKRIFFLLLLMSAFSTKNATAQSRWFSYFNHCKNYYGTTDSMLRILWFNRDATYWNGISLDTFNLPTNALVLDPQTNELNDLNYLGELKFSNTNTYQVDSAIVYGMYLRNLNQPNIVDTLRISLVYSDATVNSNLPEFFFTGQVFNYGYDTVRFLVPYYDSVKKTFRKGNAASPNVITQDILLTPASLNDTLPNGLHFFKFNLPNSFIGANQKIAISTTYRSGASYPLYDSLWNGTSWKYNIFAPLYYEQQTSQFPSYTPGNYNEGCIQFLPLSIGWNNQYIPMYASTSPAYNLEYPHVDVKLLCTTCDTIALQIYANGSSVYQPTLSGCNSQLLTTNLPGSIQLQWMLNGSNIAGATSSTYLATVSGTYVLKQTFNGVIAYSKPVNVTIYSITVNANATSTSICQGFPITLYGSGIVGNATYSWNQGVTNNAPFTPLVSLTYTVTGVDANGCSATSSIFINVLPNPNPVVLQIGASLTTTITYSSYQWYLNGNLITGATTQSYTPTQNGLYSVIVTDINGCMNQSSPFNYLTVSVDEIQENLGITVFPNPTQDVLKIHFSILPYKASIKLTDIFGHTIWTKEGDFNSDEEINLTNQSKGIYFLEIIKNERKYNLKVLNN